VLGQKGAFRLNDYTYDPKNLANGDFSLNLIDGVMRVVMGEIGQANPGALKLQVGTATISLQAGNQDKPTDASLATQDGAIAVSVIEGRLEVRLPSGAPLQVNAGETLFVSQTGNPRVGPTATMADVMGDSSLGLRMLAELAEAKSFSADIAQAQQLMASVNAALKSGAAPGTTALAALDPDTLAILAELENLPPTADIGDQPAVPNSPTPATGGAGGGTPCGASCN